MNLLKVIYPYKHQEMWVFDDEKAGLRQEPFIAGSDEIISKLVVNVPNAESGFILIFSDNPFPGYNVFLEWRREQYRGNWYYCPQLGIEGWLCPAMFHYFDQTPEKLFILFKPKTSIEFIDI
jgi:hypothetical protein